MLNLNFSKSDKKVVREVIEKGLQKEFAIGLIHIGEIVKEWEKSGSDNREAYLKLYQAVMDYDKHIGHRYDDMGGSKYLYVIAAQLADEVISPDDLDLLSEEARTRIVALSNFYKEE